MLCHDQSDAYTVEDVKFFKTFKSDIDSDDYDDYDDRSPLVMASESQRHPPEEKTEFVSHSFSSIRKLPQDAQPQPPASADSVKRAFWVSTFALLMYSLSNFPASYVVPLYLTYRWSEEANVSLTSTGNSCFINHSDPVQQAQDEIQSRVSDTMMYLGYAVSLPAMVSSILIGTYSDVVGRRKTFLTPLIGVFARCIIYIFVVRYHLNVKFLYVANAVEGICGSFSVIFLAAYSVIADINESKLSRAFWINVLDCFNQILISSFTVGIGVIVDRIGYPTVYIVCIVPVGISILTVVFFLPETRPEKEGRSLNLVANVGRLVSLYTSQGSKRQRLTLFFCLVMFCFAVINFMDANALNALFLMQEPFCWNATQISLYAAVYGAIAAICGTILMSIAMRCGCVSDVRLGMMGMLFQGGSFVLQAFAKNTWMMYMVAVLAFPTFPVTAIIRGIMSVLVGPFNQGAMFASVAIIQVVSHLLSSSTTYRVYSATVDYMPGAVFLLMAGYSFLTVVLFVVYYHVREPPPKKDLTVHADEEEEEKEKEK